MPKFIPGLQLCEQFYKDVVKGLIEKEFPQLRYSAGLIGFGSEVLGFDTERSTDHHWGPRVMLFLSDKDIGKKKRISEYLSKNLPSTFRGYSTHFGDPDEVGVQLLTEAKPGQAINHRVEVFTPESFFKEYLQIDIRSDFTAADWLTLSEQKLRTIRSGKIFHDQLGVKAVQKKLRYYPKDVWLYILASEWMKISQEEPFMGRTGDLGDEVGSRLIAARLVQSIMRLCFFMEKEYAPYSKWFSTAFSHLTCAKKLSPVLDKVLTAQNWKEREKYLSLGYELIAHMHNNLKLTKPLAVKVSPFHTRPYLVIHGEVFADELKKKIKDPAVKKISDAGGSVNQLFYDVDLLGSDTMQKLKNLYE